MLIARCQSTLTYLHINGSHCFEMPELGEVDAKNLFLYHAAKGKQFDCERIIKLLKNVLLAVILKRVRNKVFIIFHWH